MCLNGINFIVLTCTHYKYACGVLQEKLTKIWQIISICYIMSEVMMFPEIRAFECFLRGESANF